MCHVIPLLYKNAYSVVKACGVTSATEWPHASVRNPICAEDDLWRCLPIWCHGNTDCKGRAQCCTSCSMESLYLGLQTTTMKQSSQWLCSNYSSLLTQWILLGFSHSSNALMNVPFPKVDHNYLSLFHQQQLHQSYHLHIQSLYSQTEQEQSVSKIY